MWELFVTYAVAPVFLTALHYPLTVTAATIAATAVALWQDR